MKERRTMTNVEYMIGRAKVHHMHNVVKQHFVYYVNTLYAKIAKVMQSAKVVPNLVNVGVIGSGWRTIVKILVFAMVKPRTRNSSKNYLHLVSYTVQFYNCINFSFEFRLF